MKETSSKPKIGIIGIGFVGGAVKNWFEKEHYLLFCYGKNERNGSMEEVNNADIIFVCVPTPYYDDKGYDDSIVRESLARIKPGKIVVIKSTILPGSTEKFQKQFPRLAILFNPEFLVAKTAAQDFLKPDRQIVGYTKKSRSRAKKILDILPNAPHKKIMPATEAEMIKYFGNTFLSLRVIFGNQLYDLCKKMGINYDTVREWAGYDPRIGHSHFDVLDEGYRGYGGHCLPKDTKSLIQLAKSLGVNFSLLECADAINEKLKNQHNRS